MWIEWDKTIKMTINNNRMVKMNVLKSKKIIIATHVFATGPAQDLEEYLRDCIKIDFLLFIGHPLFYHKGRKGSGYKYYEYGNIIKEKYIPNWKIPEVIAYPKDVMGTLYWVFTSSTKWNLFIGSGSINAFAGILLRKMGRVEKVVFYTIDYVPQRFKNKILNRIYHWVDKYCVKNADQTWNLSSRMAEAREKQKGMKQSQYNRQITFPIGIWYNRIKRLPFNEIEKHTLVFMGHLIEKQGVQQVIEAIPDVIKKIQDFKFLIIGTGDYESVLKQKVRELDIDSSVEFTGFVEDHREIEKLLAKSACAVALYNKEIDPWTYYTDPGKVKAYLAAGLPVIITDVPKIAKDIEKYKCGTIVKYEKNDLVRAVLNLMENDDLNKNYRENAAKFAEQFDWNVTFYEYLERLM